MPHKHHMKSKLWLIILHIAVSNRNLATQDLFLVSSPQIFCHYLRTLVSFQTCTTFFLLWKIKDFCFKNFFIHCQWHLMLFWKCKKLWCACVCVCWRIYFLCISTCLSKKVFLLDAVSNVRCCTFLDKSCYNWILILLFFHACWAGWVSILYRGWTQQSVFQEITLSADSGKGHSKS